MHTTGAESVRWDLSHLFASDQEARQCLAEAEEDARQFSEKYRNQVTLLDAGQMDRMLTSFQSIQENIARVGSFAYLHWATQTGDAARGKLLQHVREAGSRIGQELLFVELEWMQVESARAEELMQGLPAWKHYLERERLLLPHVLSEPEERILVETAVTGPAAWMRFFTETAGAMRFELDGEELPQQVILSRLHDGDRALRKRAADAFTEGLIHHRRTLTYVFNTLLQHKASQDRLRKHPHWMHSRNLANEIDDKTAEALIQAVTGRYDLVARFYALKKKLLGLEELKDYDRYAPVGESSRRYSWEEACDIVLEAYTAFSPRMGGIARRFFDGKWIDAAVVPGKQGGAFSASTVPAVHPYVLLNFTGRSRDVQTLAHELGHGVHQFLSRDQGLLQADTPLTTAETASVFGEMLVFQRLMEQETNPNDRLANLVAKIDDTMATVFRQVAMNRFEDRIHRHRRAEGELAAEDFASHWMQTQEAMYQGSVTLRSQYQNWWSYIPHFLHTPGYVYAYAFGELMVLALYAKYLDSPSNFPEKYLSLLGAGGSDWPHVLVSRLDIDLQDPTFWEEGLRAIESLIAQAEALAA